jgi:lysophospholipid acyltransferase (LPLAT)-like uncharacterized protein
MFGFVQYESFVPQIYELSIRTLASGSSWPDEPREKTRGVNVGAIYIAGKGQYKIERTSVHSIRFRQFESWSRRNFAPVH